MQTRWVAAVALIAAIASVPTGAKAQLTAKETEGVKRALSLWNLDIPDLGYNRPTKRDLYRLDIVDQSLGAPLDTLTTFGAWQTEAQKSGDHCGTLLKIAWTQLGINPDPKVQAITAVLPDNIKIPSSLQEPVRVAVSSMLTAQNLVKQALAKLTAQEQADLLKSLPGFADLPGMTIKEGSTGRKLAHDAILALLNKVEWPKIRQASSEMSRGLEYVIVLLKNVHPNIPQAIPFEVDGLKVIIGSTGDDVYPSKPNELIIDLKGNDSYTGQPGAGVLGCGAVIDLEGQDTFTVSDIGGGAGVLGCGAVYDYGGNDRFMGKNVCFGAGLAGSGVLMKDGGFDEYRGKGLTQGAAIFGVGLCIDTRGNDRYDSGAYAQGFGGTKGFGWLIEQAGNDVYTIGGLHSGAPLDPQSWHCMGQGAATGYREETGGDSGGIGVLLDLKGDDLYKGGLYCQGSSYWLALGALIDMEGNDTYIADYYSQATAMHETAAYLIDYKGDDIYTVRTGAMHCIGHDYGVAVMLDREGDDIYSGKDSQPSKAIANGVSIFIESAGNDRYDGPVCVASPSRGTGSLALFVDLGGKDRYAAGLKDGEVSLSSMWAIAMDVADPFDAAITPPVTHVRPKPGTAALPATAEMERIFAKAIQWGVGDKQKEVEENVDKLVAIGVPALDWMLKNKLVTADRFSLRVFNAMLSATGDEGKALVPPYIKSSDENAALTALSLVATYKIPTDPALLKDALVNNSLAGGAIRAAGATKAVELVPALIGFAEGTDRNRSLAAILALDAIGSEDAAHTFVKLCTSPDLPIRVAATKALGKHADRALEAAKVLLTREGRPYRVGIELLGAIGTEQSIGLLLGQLKSPLAERRIEAIRALAFLDPVKYAPQIEPFTKDTDADVKAMARWALSRKP